MIEITMVVLAIALLLGLMLLATLRKSSRTQRKRIDKVFVKEKWSDITMTAAKPDQSARFAIIEADKLLDYTLKARGYRGETMAERLKDAKGDFSYIDDVWEAHKLRNKLVHEAQYEVNHRLIGRAVTHFEQALKDMGAL